MEDQRQYPDYKMSHRLRCAILGMRPTAEEELEDKAYDATLKKNWPVRVLRNSAGDWCYSNKAMTDEDRDRTIAKYKEDDEREIRYLLSDIRKRLVRMCMWRNDLLEKILPLPGDKKKDGK